MKVEVFRSQDPVVGVYTIPQPIVQVFKLCRGGNMNVALSGQAFEFDADIGFRVHLTNPERGGNLNGVIVIVEIYDSTTTPGQLLLSKDNGAASDPTYNGGGKLVFVSAERLTLDFWLSRDADLATLPAGQRTLSYRVYTEFEGHRCFALQGQFIRKAAI